MICVFIATTHCCDTVCLCPHGVIHDFISINPIITWLLNYLCHHRYQQWMFLFCCLTRGFTGCAPFLFLYLFLIPALFVPSVGFRVFLSILTIIIMSRLSFPFLLCMRFGFLCIYYSPSFYPVLGFKLVISWIISRCVLLWVLFDLSLILPVYPSGFLHVCSFTYSGFWLHYLHVSFYSLLFVVYVMTFCSMCLWFWSWLCVVHSHHCVCPSVYSFL